jgi:hypothetical protein
MLDAGPVAVLRPPPTIRVPEGHDAVPLSARPSGTFLIVAVATVVSEPGSESARATPGRSTAASAISRALKRTVLT